MITESDNPSTRANPTDSSAVIDPNTKAIVQLIDQLNNFVTQSNQLRSNLQQLLPPVELANLTLATLQQKINEAPEGSPTRTLLQQYQTVLEQFDKIKSSILAKAAEAFGLDGSDYLVAPLGKLLDQVQTGHVDTSFAIQQLNQLIRTIGIGKMISYSRMIPYVGAVIYGVIKGLDSYTATQVVLGKFLHLLEALGVNKEQLDTIRTYAAKKTFVTENYELFQKWLAQGAPFNIFPSITETLNNTQQQITNQVSNFFIPPAPASPSPTSPQDSPPATPVTVGGGGWLAGINTEPKSTRQQKNKTKKYLKEIHRSIQQHLTRLRGRRHTLRQPFHKSIASREIKRRL
jgi:hypothetical protein